MTTKTRRFNVPKPVERVTVYVNAWQYDGGAGFDWYRRPGDADAAFEEEKDNCDELKAEGWSAYRFDFVVSSKLTDEQITEAIDARIDELCVAAPLKQENILTEYGCVLSEIQKKAPVLKAVQFCYTNKSGGTNMVHVTGHKLTDFQKASARIGGDQKVKWLAEFTVKKQWNDYETGGRMIGEPVNKELKAFLKRHALASKQVIYVGQHDLLS